jgi:hypothetical protein
MEAIELAEQRLRRRGGAVPGGREALLTADRARLAELRVELDQLWDLPRRRRALRPAGQDADDAKMRDPGTVEGYLG